MNVKALFIAVAVAGAALANAAGLPWASDYKSAVALAAKTHKVVMIDFTASWCVNCHKLDRTTYLDPGVTKALAGVVPVRVDYDKENAIAKRYKAQALPVIVFVDAHQREIGRIVGYLDAKGFIAKATPILAKAK
ncbi:MAG TPA: thioredoxin family protein [Fimbriimonadaceae bacterium]|nr:thioredoxin family protein [Fimbriimonadaceae bacterium]